MGAYFQMGHDTENLVGERDLTQYSGLILSPVNRNPEELYAWVRGLSGRGEYDIVFDPQLYFPRSQRGQLQSHPYFPSDIDTADLSSSNWWNAVNSSLSNYARGLGVDAVASPAILPNTFDDDYFTLCVESSVGLSGSLADSGIRTLATVAVSLAQMRTTEAALRVASIISEAEPAGYYLVVVSDMEPRRELDDPDGLAGVMSLIDLLERSGPVLVSHCSSDMVLFKAAGATHCASGKFFNLRRFTKSRYDEPAGGGGQLAYWFEHNLFAFLREADVLRLQRGGFGELIGGSASGNEWADAILRQFSQGLAVAWVGKGWRQYLSWFGRTEGALDGDASPGGLAGSWLLSAEQNWLRLEDAGILFDEPRNDGHWIRHWRQALSSFRRNR